jgi:hypothetical protein
MKEFKINLEDKEFTTETLSKLTNNVYFIPTKIYNQLLEVEFPIKNRELAIEQICEFIDLLVFKVTVNNETLFEINIEEFINIFNRDTYIRFKEILKELNILSQVQHKDGTYYDYQNGINKLYRIYNEYLDLKDYSVIVFDNKKQKINIELRNLRFDIDDRFIGTIKNIEIDKAKAIQIQLNEFDKGNLKSKFALMMRLSRIFNLDKSRYITQGVKVNRVFHSFSNIDRLSRKCIIIKLYEIDVKNCQPTLMVIYLIKNNLISLKDQDFINYKKDCEDGVFYEKLMVDGDNRSDIKVESYKSIFFKFNKNNIVNKRFKKLYPNVWNTLNYISKDDYISFAFELQNIEAEIFNNLIVNKSTNYFTLHDAIYFNNAKDKASLYKQIKNYGKKYNVKINLTFEINKIK